MSVSHTTRAKRAGEQDGVDYYFVDRPAFRQMIKEDQFLEHAQVYNHLYGTAKQSVEHLIEQGKHVILDIDWQGARQVRAKQSDVISIFILPPSIEALEQRLRARGLDDEATIQRRMQGARNELAHEDEYQYRIVNDDFASALDQLNKLFERAWFFQTIY